MVRLCDLLRYVGCVRGLKKRGFLLEMKSWQPKANCFPKRNDEIAGEEEADDLEALMRLKSRYHRYQELKEAGQEKIESRERSFELQHVGGVVLSDFEVNIVVMT